MKEFTEFTLFIQSIGFIYNRNSFGSEYYTIGDYTIRVSRVSQFSHGSYSITQKVQMGVTRIIFSSSINNIKNDLDIFKSIIREVKLNKLLE